MPRDNAQGDGTATLGRRDSILDSDEIDAAIAGGGHLWVTKGSLARASDDCLRAILADQIAHEA